MRPATDEFRRFTTEAKLRVAVLVHNSVMNDARVIKEALTLWKAGHQVTIHGISPKEFAVQQVLPDTGVAVFLEPPVIARERKLLRKASRTSASGAVRFGLMWPLQLLEIGLLGGLMWWVLSGLHDAYAGAVGTPAFLGIALLMGAIAAVAFGRFRREQWKVLGAYLRHSATSRPQQHTTPPAAQAALAQSTPGARYHRLSQALLKSLEQQPAPDVIHLHDHVALTLARELKARYRVPLVWDAHEIYEELASAEPDRARDNAAIIAANHAYVDHFITINASIARFYGQQYPGLPTAKIVMNATIVGPVPEDDGRLHAAAALPRTQKILLFQGGFGLHRGLHQLVEAAAGLPAEWTLVLMGWGKLESELRTLASQQPRAGACPAVVFLPGVPQQELQQWTAGATLGVIPYENTGLNHLYCTPNKLWEYPCAGVPVLASDLVEMAAMIKTHQFGFLLPREFTGKDIISALTGLTDQALAEARANAARFLEVNNWSVWEQNLLAIYQEIGATLAASAAQGHGTLARPD